MTEGKKMAFTAVFPLNKWRRPARRGGFISWKVGGGPCALICLPEIGFQGGRPFARIGVGLAWDTPGISLAEDVRCDARDTTAYAGLDAGPIGGTFGGTAGRDGRWGPVAGGGISIKPSDWRGLKFGVGGGVSVMWTRC